MTNYDGLYHQIFGLPEMVAELLEGFAPAPWQEDHDLRGITRLNSIFHTETGKRREGDEIWKIPRRDGGATFLLLLLEFQSKSDPWMALRLHVYLGLLWQHVIKEKELLPDGRLPPVLPVVLHRGKAEWTAPIALRQLIGLEEGSLLWKFQPDLRYHLIDVVKWTEPNLEKRSGLVPLLFRTEIASDPARLLTVARAVRAEIERNPAFAPLRRAFAELLVVSMRPWAEGIEVMDDLVEVTNMLETRFADWQQKFEQQMLQQGRQEGREEGREEGRQVGEAAVLTRLLERRFGPLPTWARDRIAAADTHALEEWCLRVLDQPSLEDVLA